MPWLGGLLALYLLSPIGDFIGRLVTAKRLSSPGTAGALLVSVETATIATAVIAIVGVPLAYLLARGRSRTSAVVGVAVQLPIALPPLMSGILLLYLVGPLTPLGRLFGGRLTDDIAGIVLAQVFVAAPFLVVAARSSFAAVDPALEDVAATLGHRRWSTFWRVSIPAAMPGIVAGLLLAWLRAFGEFGATVILAYHPYSLPVFTYVQFGSTGLAATILPVAATLGASLVILGVAAALAGRTGARSRPAPVVPARSPATRTPFVLDFGIVGNVGRFHVEARAKTARSLAILGPTGAGKTLTIRMLAGLLHPTAGAIHLDGVDVTTRAPQLRQIGYVPQDSSLLPHLPVWRQVGFGVGADPAVAAYWMDQLDLAHLAQRRPAQLSGGQRRKVALARALTREPRLLVLDEPFTGLDTPVRDELRRELRRLQHRGAPTVVVVTHDPYDAAMLADDVLILAGGRVLQTGPVHEVYRAPSSLTVARLLGIPNAFELAVTAAGRVGDQTGASLTADTGGLSTGEQVIATVDPAGVAVHPRGPLSATVTDLIDVGITAEVALQVSAAMTLRCPPPRGLALQEGDVVQVDVAPSAIRVTKQVSG